MKMPNFPMKTGGGHVFWTTLEEKNGWKLQRNTVFGNCRILDSDDYRIGWGDYKGMKDLFDQHKH